MPKPLQSLRGMSDILPNDIPLWRCAERKITTILTRYGYREIRIPLLEQTELFARSVGDQTDIVTHEMYSFDDRNGKSLTLRPEGTAGCVRAGIEHGLFRQPIQKLWYLGPMFRHERPQQGRYRQFYQIGVEVFGPHNPNIEAELIALGNRLWHECELKQIRLQINSLGTRQTRHNYRSALIDYFSTIEDQLDADSRRRLYTNPLRILDSKNPALQALINGAPTIADYFDAESGNHFERLQRRLDDLDITYEVNPQLVRGLDYYDHTVFEWVSDQLGAQGTVCAGGRYNDLVEICGGQSVPACGLAMGMERLLALMSLSLTTNDTEPIHVYLIMATDDVAVAAGMRLAESLRDELPWLNLMVHHGNERLKTQFKHADKSGALFALILGEQEVDSQTVGLKSLRVKTEQKAVSWREISKVLSKNIRHS